MNWGIAEMFKHIRCNTSSVKCQTMTQTHFVVVVYLHYPKCVQQCSNLNLHPHFLNQGSGMFSFDLLSNDVWRKRNTLLARQRFSFHCLFFSRLFRVLLRNINKTSTHWKSGQVDFHPQFLIIPRCFTSPSNWVFYCVLIPRPSWLKLYSTFKTVFSCKKETEFLVSFFLFIAELAHEPEVNVTTKRLNGTREVTLTWKVNQLQTTDTRASTYPTILKWLLAVSVIRGFCLHFVFHFKTFL